MKRPSLNNSKMISVDIETYDPELKGKGPGVQRKDGNILGVSIANDTGFSEYYNVGHRRTDKEEKQKNVNYLKEVLGNNIDKVGANILYDLDWLQNSKGITVNGKIHDVQYAEPLLDEYALRYNLDALSKKYLGEGKFKTEIQKFCDERGLKGDARQHLYMMPYEIVRQYAKVDAEEPIKIIQRQLQALKVEGLDKLYEMEIGLIPLLLQMRTVGVRIDSFQTLKTKKMLERDLLRREKSFFSSYGEINYKSTKQLAPIFDDLGIPYPKTDKGNPSITQDMLKTLSDKYEICGDIVKLKKLARVISATFQNVLIDANTNGRIFATFAPLKSDDKGTVSGRFSSFNPNLQQVPAKNENFGKEVRSCFIPEEGQDWGKLDYSQIEYRVLAHYAQGERADEVREKYRENPNTDYHQLVMDWTKFNRKIAKNLNFGCMYAMGIKTCSEKFRWSLEDSKLFINKYHREAPYVKTTMNNVINVSKGRGYIKTILGRKARVSDEIKKYGKEYIMFNRLIQGSAADIMKKGMVDAYDKGLFNVLTPHLTVHDELDISIPRNKEGKEAVLELKHTMENCVDLKVPIKVDLEIGSSWGTVKEIEC